jgi:hypothetical protein
MHISGTVSLLGVSKLGRGIIRLDLYHPGKFNSVLGSSRFWHLHILLPFWNNLPNWQFWLQIWWNPSKFKISAQFTHFGPLHMIDWMIVVVVARGHNKPPTNTAAKNAKTNTLYIFICFWCHWKDKNQWLYSSCHIVVRDLFSVITNWCYVQKTNNFVCLA